MADQTTNAFLDAKIPKANIETDKLRLSRTEIDEKRTARMKKDRQFTTEQSWHGTVSAAQAQIAVDLAMKSGATELDDVQWKVADPGLGAKLGELVYASNRVPVPECLGE